MITLDPLGLSLLRQLCEADEAQRLSAELYSDEKHMWPSRLARDEYHQRVFEYEALLADFLEHLEYMPCPEIEAGHYHALWAHYQAISEDERNMGRLFDLAQDIGLKAMALYRESEDV